MDFPPFFEKPKLTDTNQTIVRRHVKINVGGDLCDGIDVGDRNGIRRR